MEYIVFKSEDVYEALQGEGNEDLRDAFETILRMVAMYREAQGKQQNDYLVINKDEPYANEVIEIMDKHGHWEGEVRKAYVLKEKTGRYRCHNIFVDNEEYHRNVANARIFHSKKNELKCKQGLQIEHLVKTF